MSTYVLVSIKKLLHTKWLKKTQIHTLTILEVRSSNSILLGLNQSDGVGAAL